MCSRHVIPAEAHLALGGLLRMQQIATDVNLIIFASAGI